jgi:hypothetical protein
MSATAGCLGGDDEIARCASEGESSGTDELRKIAPLTGDEQVSLGIVVSSDAVSDDQYEVIEVTSSDGTLVTSIPLGDNRDMNRLSQEDHPVLASADGELYAVPLGPPPVHGVFTASLLTPDGDQRAAETVRFNCYSEDGSLP